MTRTALPRSQQKIQKHEPYVLWTIDIVKMELHLISSCHASRRTDVLQLHRMMCILYQSHTISSTWLTLEVTKVHLWFYTPWNKTLIFFKDGFLKQIIPIKLLTFSCWLGQLKANPEILLSQGEENLLEYVPTFSETFTFVIKQRQLELPMMTTPHPPPICSTVVHISLL